MYFNKAVFHIVLSLGATLACSSQTASPVPIEWTTS
jgi:hypothetical protein